MSQFIFDEQLAASEVLAPLRKRLKVTRLSEIRPTERILDDRIPEILLSLKQYPSKDLHHLIWPFPRKERRRKR